MDRIAYDNGITIVCMYNSADCKIFICSYRTTPETRSPAVARIANRTGCQWPPRSSKVDDLFILCERASNHGPIFYPFEIHVQLLVAWNFPLKIAAVPLQMETWLLTAFYPMTPSPTTYDLRFSHNTARFAYRIIVMRYDPSRSSKVDDFHFIWKGVCHFLLVVYSNFGPVFHRV